MTGTPRLTSTKHKETSAAIVVTALRLEDLIVVGLQMPNAPRTSRVPPEPV